MGQKFSSWKHSRKEKRIAKEREEELKRKNKLHQHGDYTVGDPTVPDVPNPAPAAPAPPPAPVAGAATAVSIGMLRDFAPDPNAQPGKHEAQILASRENASTVPPASSGFPAGGYPYAGTAAGGYGLMGGDFSGIQERGDADDDSGPGTGGMGGTGGGMGGPGGGGMGGSSGGAGPSA